MTQCSPQEGKKDAKGEREKGPEGTKDCGDIIPRVSGATHITAVNRTSGKAIRVQKKRKVQKKPKADNGNFMGMDLSNLEINYDLGRSKKRWLFGISLGVIFLLSVFVPLFWGAVFITLGVVFFWFALWLGWPARKSGRKGIVIHVFIQLFFCLVFVISNYYFARLFYDTLSRSHLLFRFIYICVFFPLWLKTSDFLFVWMTTRIGQKG